MGVDADELLLQRFSSRWERRFRKEDQLDCFWASLSMGLLFWQLTSVLVRHALQYTPYIHLLISPLSVWTFETRHVLTCSLQRRWSLISPSHHRSSDLLASGLTMLWASPWDGTTSSSWVCPPFSLFRFKLIPRHSIQHSLRNHRHPRASHLLDGQDPRRCSRRGLPGDIRVRSLHTFII